MRIGMLGDIVFEVSDNVVKTINNASISGSALYAKHQLHLSNGKTEFTGADPVQMQFDIVLSAYLGVNPNKELSKINEYRRNGRTLPLVIGHKVYGEYRWTIQSYQAKLQYFDGEGDLTQCVVTVKLLEYVR